MHNYSSVSTITSITPDLECQTPWTLSYFQQCWVSSIQHWDSGQPRITHSMFLLWAILLPNSDTNQPVYKAMQLIHCNLAHTLYTVQSAQPVMHCFQWQMWHSTCHSHTCWWTGWLLWTAESEWEIAVWWGWYSCIQVGSCHYIWYSQMLLGQ